VKIFVSYSRRDAGDFARQIYQDLKDDHDVFTDVNNIQAGDAWSTVIENNISACDLFVTIITHAALRSPNVGNEVSQAQRENKTIIPCIHRDVAYDEIKWNLDKIQGVEFEDKYELVRNLYSKIIKSQKKSGKGAVAPAAAADIPSPESKAVFAPTGVPAVPNNAHGSQYKESHYPPKSEKPRAFNLKILIPIIGGVAIIASIIGLTFLGGSNSMPIASAGPHQTVNSGDLVTLDGSKSRDSDGTVTSYLWTESLGPDVTLNGADTARPSFTAPNVTSDTKLIFGLTVKDDKGAASKPTTVDIIVKPINHPPVVSNQSVVTSMNTPKDIPLGASVSDPEKNDNFTARIMSKPSHGKLSPINQVTGIVIYTPNAGFAGADRFTFKVNDGKLDSKSTGVISINVRAHSPG